MDIHRVIAELRTYLELLDDAILSLEHLASENHRSLDRPARHRPAGSGAALVAGNQKEMPSEQSRVMSAGAESL